MFRQDRNVALLREMPHAGTDRVKRLMLNVTRSIYLANALNWLTGSHKVSGRDQYVKFVMYKTITTCDR